MKQDDNPYQEKPASPLLSWGIVALSLGMLAGATYFLSEKRSPTPAPLTSETVNTPKAQSTGLFAAPQTTPSPQKGTTSEPKPQNQATNVKGDEDMHDHRSADASHPLQHISPEMTQSINQTTKMHDKGLKQETLSGGGKTVKLNGHYRHAPVAIRDPSGEVNVIEVGRTLQH